MNKKLLIAIVIALCLIVALTVVSCNQWDTPYKQLNKDGNSVSVKFLTNGGVFAGTPDITIVDAFSIDDAKDGPNGQKTIVPVDPSNEEIRGRYAFTISRTNSSFAGWYVTTVNEDGTYNITSQKWNFGDTFSFDPSKVSSSDEPVLILSARWEPYTEFKVFIQNNDGSFPLEPSVSVKQEYLEYPVWNTNTGKLRYNDYPEKVGFTFDKAYKDSSLTEEVTANVKGNSYLDEESGEFVTDTMNIYVTYKEGAWFKIYNARSFSNNANANGNYEICADLNFSGVSWNSIFSAGTFNGKIYGNNFSFTNIKANQSSTTNTYHGLFSVIGQNALIENLTIDSSSFTVNGMGNTSGAPSYYGLLAGKVENGASLSGVKLSNSKILLNSGKSFMFDKVDNITVSQNYQNMLAGRFIINLTIASDENTTSITKENLSVEFSAPNEKVFVDGVYNKYPSGEVVQKSVSELFTISNDSDGFVTITPVA